MDLRVRRRVHAERGAAAVEFALVAPVLFLILFGIIQYGWYFYVASSASHAANSVVRRLEVGDCWASTEADAYVTGQMPAAGATDPQVTMVPATLAGATVGSTQLHVTVTADAKLLDFVPMPNDGVVTRVVSAPLEDDQVGAPC